MQATYLVPSMIGGVSEQSPQDRPSYFAEEQINCINSPLNGVMSRPGGLVLGTVTNNFVDPFVHEIRRSNSEHYKVLIENGKMLIINLITGTVCSQKGFSSYKDYFKHTGPARTAFDVVTVADTTFIVNRQKTVKLASTLSAERPNRGIFYFRSGAYSTTYKAVLKVGSTSYSAQYTTPDNSSATNGQYITTSRLANELKDAFNTIKTSVAPALNAFTFSRNGSNVVIACSNSTAFELDSEDGQGDTHLIAFADWVKKFSDLPVRAPNGYVVGIRGSASDQKDDYWVRFNGPETTGFWEEVAKPGIKTTLDATTMPHLLKNSGKNSFSVERGKWNKRISGDGVNTSKNPNFVGKRIRSLNFIAGRLAIMTEGSFMASRSRNAFCFFPDTAQKRLATDPIGFDVASGSVTVLKSSVAVSEKLFFWGDGAQLRLDSGDNALTEETADAIPAMNFEYDGTCRPIPMGMSSVIFGTASGDGSSMREVMFRAGVPVGEIPLNEHCPKYIKGSLRSIFVGETFKTIGVITSNDTSVYIYRWFNEGENRVQSSWSRWTFSGVDKVVTGAIANGYVYLLLQIGPTLVTERIPLDPLQGRYRDIRLDHRVTEAGATFNSSHLATLNLPYTVPSDLRDSYIAVEDDESADNIRGRPLTVTWVDGNTIRVQCRPGHHKFFFGTRCPAARTFSDLFIQTKEGTYLPDHLLIQKLRISHVGTSEYDVLVKNRLGEVVRKIPFNGRKVRSATQNNRLALDMGQADFEIDSRADEVTITLSNPTIYPSRWLQAEFFYTPTKR